LDAQKERAKEMLAKDRSKAVAEKFEEVMTNTIARGHARGNQGIDTDAAKAAPAVEVKPTWITPAVPDQIAAPVVSSFAGSGINPARLARITGQVAPDAVAAPAPVAASHGINPARLARMTGQTSATAVEGPVSETVNELGDTRETVDGRALDSVDEKITKGVTKVEIEQVKLDERGENIYRRMGNQEWRKAKKTWDLALLEGGPHETIQDFVRAEKTKGVDIADLKATIAAKVGGKVVNVMALRAYIEQFPDIFLFIEALSYLSLNPDTV